LSEPIIQLATIAVIGIGSQWLAWRLKLPSILLLLLSGFVLGPVTGWIDPDALLGEALFPFVSIAVGIILFEGGLTLKLKELPVSGPIIFRLISLGAVATMAVATLGARYLLGFSWPIALLTGAILIVTGPTVVGPLLRQIRPRGHAGAILKWEGILIDPVGAVLAVLLFELIRHEGVSNVPGFIAFGALTSLLVGVSFGLLGAGILILLVSRHLIPDYLQNSVTLLLVIGLFVLSAQLAHEAGLITVTVMGVALANQRWISIRHILEFKENLQILLIGVLFILLAGRVETSILTRVGWEAVVFVLLLVVVARPLGVWLSTWRSPLTSSERLFLMWLAPRGIVAAAVASIFAFELSELGYHEAELLAATIFLVIVGTVIFYGLTAGLVARRLGLSEQNPQGVLIIGAHLFARNLAEHLNRLGFRVVLLDSNYRQVISGRLAGLEVVHGNALSEETLDELELGGIGRMLALTGNDEVNTLLALHFPDVFGRSEVYQLPPGNGISNFAPAHMRGRFLFGADVTYGSLISQLENGATLKATTLSNAFTISDYEATHGLIQPLCLVTRDNRLTFFTVDNQPSPKPGHTIISLISASDGHTTG